MNILAARLFGRVETGFLVKIESKWVDNLPVSAKWLQKTSKLFHVFKKQQNWKNLVSTLVNIQALPTGEIMGEETGSRFKFNLILSLYESCFKITTYGIFKVILLRMRIECPIFKLK